MSKEMDSVTKMFLEGVLAEMQNAEEMGGPRGEQYVLLMEAIAAEATRRVGVYRSNGFGRDTGYTD